MVGILDVPAQDLKAVEIGGQRRGDGGPTPVRMLGQGLGGAGRVRGGLRPQAQLPDHVAALAEGHHVAGDHADVGEGGAGIGHQLVTDGLEPLPDDLQAGGRQQVVHVPHPPGDGILHRDEAERASPGADGLEGVLEGGAGGRLMVGEVLPAGLVAVGAELSLESDAGTGHAPVLSASARAAARSAGVSTEMGAVANTAA